MVKNEKSRRDIGQEIKELKEKLSKYESGIQASPDSRSRDLSQSPNLRKSWMKNVVDHELAPIFSSDEEDEDHHEHAKKERLFYDGAIRSEKLNTHQAHF